jgi:cytochrome c-type biogenesis protein CcmF
VRPFTTVMFFIAGWVLFATFNEFARKTGYFRSWRHLPRSFYGMTVAHTGFALLLIGSVTATSWVTEKTLWMAPRDHINVAGHEILFLGTESGIGENYDFDRGNFSVPASDDEFTLLRPEKRWYPAPERMTSETALHLFGLDMLYVVLGDQDERDSSRWVVRIYYHPFVGLLLIGASLIAFGGLVSMTTPKREEPAK